MVGQARIIETANIADAIAVIDEDTWFLVDLDNTMFEGKQALGHVHWFYDEMDQVMQTGMSRDDAVRTVYPHWERLQHACPVQPLEEDFVPSLIALQNQGVVVMGLTHRHPTVVNPTIAQVASLEFDFTRTAPSAETLRVPAANPTIYTHGILFCSDFNLKSDVFKTFTSMIGKSPKKIVFIDDRKKNVEEVVENLSKCGIECIGIYYTAIEHAEPVYSRELAQFQAQCLQKIMSNEAAALLMEHGLQ